MSNKKGHIFTNIIFLEKFIFLIIYNYINCLFDCDSFVALLVIMFYLIIIYYFTMFLFDKTESIINLHRMLDKVLEDKNTYQSLFKITHEIKNPIAVCK